MKPIQKPRGKSLHLNDRRRRRRVKKGPVIVVVSLVVAGIVGGVIWFSSQSTTTEIPLTPQPTSTVDDAPSEETPTTQYDITTPSSTAFVINKQRPLASDYVPANLVIPNMSMRADISGDEQYVTQTTATALEAMVQAAAADGIELVLGSGYRSYDLQETLFSSYEAISGTEEANMYSAKAGQSEHQTGLAIDLVGGDYECYLDTCFEATPAGQWLKTHAHEYGFILRFMSGKESITGYQYEPWHFRYVGVELATTVTSENVTLEEYFNLN